MLWHFTPNPTQMFICLNLFFRKKKRVDKFDISRRKFHLFLKAISRDPHSLWYSGAPSRRPGCLGGGGDGGWWSGWLLLLGWGKNEFLTFAFQPCYVSLSSHLILGFFFLFRWGVSYLPSLSRCGVLGSKTESFWKMSPGISVSFLPAWVLTVLVLKGWGCGEACRPLPHPEELLRSKFLRPH